MIWQEDEKIWEWLPKLQCHRGYWVKGSSQNSIEAIKKAFELGYKMTEFDVRLTKDKEVVLFHDANINGKWISDLTFEELQKEITVSKLEELLKWFDKVEDFKLNIEIKNDEVFNYEIERLVCSLVREFELEDRVLISSFNPLSLAKVRLFNSKIYRALLLSFERNHGNNWVVMSSVGNYFCCPHVLHMRSLDFIKYANNYKSLSKKIPIVLWTVNDFRIYEAQKEIVHGVISDEITPEVFKN
jgi:glycerophosphoryl diester phosphodiesterase